MEAAVTHLVTQLETVVPAAPAPGGAVIFDLDGTLADSLVGIEHAARLACRAVWPDRELPTLRPWLGPPVREVLRRALGPVEDADLDTAVAHFRRHYDGESWKRTIAYPGCAEVLATLRARGMRLFIATNKPALATARIVKHLGLWASFEAVWSPDSAAPPYPTKADLVRAMLDHFSLDPAATWLVGDSSDDREAARRAALRFIPALYGYGGLEQPGVTGLGRLADLPDWLGAPLPLESLPSR